MAVLYLRHLNQYGYYQDILFEGADKDFPNLQIENAHPFVRLTFNDNNNGARLYSLRNDNVVRLADGSQFFYTPFPKQRTT